MKRLICFLFIVSFLHGEETPASVSKESDGWVTRSFSLPRTFFQITDYSDQSTDTDTKQIDDPFSPEAKPQTVSEILQNFYSLRFPTREATEDEWTKYIRSSSPLIEKFLNLQLSAFPAGSTFLFDPNTSTLAVRTSEEAMTPLIEVCNWIQVRIPSMIVLRIDIFQANSEVMRKLVSDIASKEDHSEQWNELNELVKKGSAQSIGTLRIETKSGNTCYAESSSAIEQTNRVTINEQGNVAVTKSTVPIGFRVDVSPVISPDGSTVNVDFTLQYDIRPPSRRNEQLTLVANLPSTPIQLIDRNRTAINSSMFLQKGTTRLMGVWAVNERPDVMQAVFLKADVALITRENKALIGLLEKYADKPPPFEKTKSEGKPPTPDGLETRRFRIPPDFASAANGANKADPFDRSTPQMSPQQFLETQGIRFPTGAKAYYSPATSILTVINTPQNLDAVYAFEDSLTGRTDRPALHATVHIIEADGATLRKIAEGLQSVSDHTEAWRQLEALTTQGKARRLQDIHVETRPGGRATFETGLLRSSMSVFKLTDEEVGNKNDGPSADVLMTSEIETKRIGTIFEIEPNLGPDDFTIDLAAHLTQHQETPAMPPPAQLSEGPALAEPVPNVKTTLDPASLESIPCFKTEIHLTTSSGIYKLIGLWKPEGMNVSPKAEPDVLRAAFLRMDVIGQ